MTHMSEWLRGAGECQNPSSGASRKQSGLPLEMYSTTRHLVFPDINEITWKLNWVIMSSTVRSLNAHQSCILYSTRLSY